MAFVWGRPNNRDLVGYFCGESYGKKCRNVAEDHSTCRLIPKLATHEATVTNQSRHAGLEKLMDSVRNIRSG
jgi:hypothetical protein